MLLSTYVKSIRSFSSIAVVRRNGQSAAVLVSPNPANNFLTISLTDASVKGQPAAIYSVDGRVMESLLLGDAQNIDLNNWAAGTYILKLPNGETTRILKR